MVGYLWVSLNLRPNGWSLKRKKNPVGVAASRDRLNRFDFTEKCQLVNVKLFDPILQFHSKQFTRIS